MKISHLLVGLITGMFILCTANVSNANLVGTVVGDNGRAIGINGLVFENLTYNVTFETGSFDSLNLTSWAFMGNEQGANDISRTINTLLTNGDWTSVTPNNPILGVNGMDEQYCIPYEKITDAGTNHVYIAGGAYPPAFVPSYPAVWWILGGQNSTDYSTVYAIVTPTPIPSAVFLLGSGLMGLTGLRRSNKC